MLAAVTLGIGAVGGTVGIAAGTAGAATTLPTAKISAASTTIAYVGTNQPAGTVTITLPTGTLPKTNILQLTVANTPAGGTVDFTATPTVTSSNVHVAILTPAVGSPFLGLTLTTKTPGSTATITVSNIHYTTDATSGLAKDVTVNPKDFSYTFSPLKVSNASYPPPPPSTPISMLLYNLTPRPIPPVGVGATGMTAGSWSLIIGGAATQGVGKGSYVTISVTPHTGTTDCATTNAVAFDGTPTVTFTAKGASHVTATPKFSVKLLGTGVGCSTKFAPNRLQIHFTNTVKFTTSAGGHFTLLITGVKYSTAFATTTGTVTVSDAFYAYTGSVTKAITGTASDAKFTITSTNAIVSDAYLSANTPAVTVTSHAYDHPISPIKVVESVAGSVPKGYVCVSIADSERPSATGSPSGGTTTLRPGTTGPNYFDSTSKGTLKVTGGNAKASTLHFVTVHGSTASVIAFKVTAASTGTPSTYVISGVAVNSDSTGRPPVVTARYDSTATCATQTGRPTDNVAVAYTVTVTSTRIYGETADATAAAELQARFPGTGTIGSCPGLDFTPFPKGPLAQRPVVLARDNGYTDALASQYLAQYLNTGTLLTPTGAISTVTLSAIRHEGITEVYVVGGPLAVSTTVVATLRTTPVYHCGGRNLTTTTTGSPKYIQVNRITGPTEYATAEAIDQYVPKTHVRAEDLSGAYTGKNATGGLGMYNDTAGTASSAPGATGYLPTAILATGLHFQDAESASVLSYSESLPVLLTTPTTLSPETLSVIETLNIKQVILMGGQDAVTNTVVKQLEALTVSVLRVAGKTYSTTSVQLADMEVATVTGHTGLGWTPGGDLLVARGTFFSDGIAGAVLEHVALANRLHATTTDVYQIPLVLTKTTSTVGAALTAFLKKAGATGIDTMLPTGRITHLTILGGPIAITPAAAKQMETDLKS